MNKDISTMRRMTKLLMLLCLLVVGRCALAQTTGTVTYVYTDPQGTPLAEADAGGNITATFDYTPYGTYAPTGTSSPGPTPNGPGYTGHVSDPETNLVYMQARYYDPATGHFLSVDPVVPNPGNAFNFNRYDYATNNPILNSDPTGRQSAADFAKLNQCAGSCSLVMMDGKWQAVGSAQAGQSVLAQQNGGTVSNYVPATRQETANGLDNANAAAAAGGLATSEVPPLAALFGAVDETTAVGALVLDPTWARFTNVMTAGMFKLVKKTAAGNKMATKSVEKAEKANQAVTVLTATQPGYSQANNQSSTQTSNAQQAQPPQTTPQQTTSQPPPPKPNTD